MKSKRVIVAGSRYFSNYDLLSNELEKYIERIREDTDGYKVEIVSGACKGADRLGEKFAAEHGYQVARFPADWKGIGRRAGYIRNAEMAKYASERDGVLFAFWDGESRGTMHMIDLAVKYGLEIHVILFSDSV